MNKLGLKICNGEEARTYLANIIDIQFDIEFNSISVFVWGLIWFFGSYHHLGGQKFLELHDLQL